MTEPPEPLVTLTEAAHEFGVPVRRLAALIRDGELEATDLGA